MHLKYLVPTLTLIAASASAQERSFHRIASFPVADNMGAGADVARVSSAEIVDATDDGMTLVYTDSPLGVVGRIDITDPADPRPLGTIDVAGEPTSVAVIGTAAFVGVNTSESFTDPSGRMAVLDLQTGTEAYSCDLGGQPDSLAAAPDGRFVAVAIENERDEEAGDGRVGQSPSGWLAIVPVDVGTPDCEGQIRVDLTGLSDIAPDDAEPEFVDVNAAGEIVVTLQENDHVVLVSPAGEILSDFTAGAVTLEGVDATEDGALDFTETLEDVVREPDAVGWIGTDHVATANEGDMDGGSRGWTIFDRAGGVVYDSGTAFERALIAIGHYPEGRSENKGVEPESIEVATFGGTPMVFVGSERGSAVGVYDVADPAAPRLLQVLPSGIGPEGYVAIPGRDLLISANETDLVEDGGARSHVMIFAYGEGAADYPTLTSEGTDPLIGWGALSGLAAGDGATLYAVSDSVYAAQPRIFTIDTSRMPARITGAMDVTRDGAPAAHMDMEGIAADGQGGFWIANEGRGDRGIPHALYHVDAQGAITDEIARPDMLRDEEDRYGFEGVTRAPDGTLWIAVQRPWGDDPEGMTKLLSYDPESGEWAAVLYPLAETEAGWVGLSEIAAHGGWLYLVERDNQIGAAARIKHITRVALDGLSPAPLGGELPVVAPEMVRDLIPDLTASGGYVLDKVEGLTFAADGDAWIVTDNDGVDDSSGETLLLNLGAVGTP